MLEYLCIILDVPVFLMWEEIIFALVAVAFVVRAVVVVPVYVVVLVYTLRLSRTVSEVEYLQG